MVLRSTTAAILGALIFSVSCNKTEGGDMPASPVGSAAKPGPAAGGGGGFSADLAKELGGGSAKADGSAAKPGGDAVGSGSGAALAGSDAAKAGSGAAKAGS